MMDKEDGGHAHVGGRLLAAGAIVAIGGVGFFVAREEDPLFATMLMLTGFGAVGLFYLICTLLGICRLTSSELRHAPLIQMLNQIEQAIVITDQEGSLRYMNPSYRQLTGGRKRKIEFLFSIDEKASRTIARLRKILREGGSGYEEITLPCPLNHKPGEGEPTAIYAIHVSKGEAAGEAIHIWMVEDISRRHQYQINQFTELTQAIDHLDHAPAGVVAWDKDGKITYLNATLASWIGVDLATHMTDRLTLSRLIGAQCAGALQKYLGSPPSSQQSPLVFELDLFHDRGKRLPVHFHLNSVRQDGEAVGRAVLTLHNLTKPSLGRDVVRLDEDSLSFAHYFNSCPIALAVIDGRGLVQKHNPYFAWLFALGEDQQDIHIEALIAADDGNRLKQVFEQAENQQQITPFDTQIATHGEAADEARYIRLFIRKLEEDDDLVIIAVIETSEQKGLERQARALEQHMEQGQKMQAVGQLAGGIAHDFNNVLTAIIMSCDLLLSNHRSSDPSHPDILNIKNNANRAATLVRQLLAFSRRQTLRPEVFDISDMLADLRLLLTRLVGIAIDVEIEHGRDLWLIKADKSELDRALINLASNARDAMPDGGILTLRSRNIAQQDIPPSLKPQLGNGDYVLIEVKDSGTGMTEAIREKIFEPFFTTKEVGRGTGLGLSMVYGMITQTGGHIHCDSQPGEGTSFSLYLPRYQPSGQEEAPPSPTDKKVASLNAHDLSGSATILVVEDEDGVRMGSVKALQSRGYKVLEATTGLEALDIIKAEQEQIDLVVSDVVMPEMDGPSLLRELRALNLNIKFIFVSGYAEEAFAKNLPKDAQFAFLSKPFSLKQLALKVKEVLEKKQEEVL